MSIISAPVAWFTHRQFRLVSLKLNFITTWMVQEWVTELNDPDDTKLYEKFIEFEAYRMASVITLPVAVSPDPGTPAELSIVGGLNLGDTITIDGNDTSGGGSVAYPQIVYEATVATTSQQAANAIVNLIVGTWGLPIAAVVAGDEYAATVEINNADSLEITGAVYFSNLPVIPADAG